MTRGVNLKLPPGTVVRRALGAIYDRPEMPDGAPADWTAVLVQYRLEGGYNGGKDPRAPHCGSWSFGKRVPTADCVGFALWAEGIDRFQPGYSGSRGEWLNCDSIIDDADGARTFFRQVGSLEGRPGDMLVMPAGPSGHGHMGVIIAAGNSLAAGPELWVVDCSPRHAIYSGVATAKVHGAINIGRQWSSNCQIIRPVWHP